MFENKNSYSITCQDIADLLNAVNGEKFDESVYRKRYREFSLGRKYEKEQKYKEAKTKILSISDIHFPFHLPIETFKDYRDSNILVLNGDLIDHQSISKFVKTYRINPMEELIGCRKYLIELIQYINPEKVYVIYGNHELRFPTFISNMLKSELQELMPSNVLELMFDDGFYHYNKREHSKTWFDPICSLFDEIQITYTKDWKYKIGKTWFAHPITYSSGILKTCEKFMKNINFEDQGGYDSIVIGHTHQSAECRKGKVTLYEQGACCAVEEMDYVNGRLSDPQQKGFIVVYQDKYGSNLPELTQRIILD